MPKDLKTGKSLLTAVKKDQTDRQAERTALALARIQSSSESVSSGQETSAPAPLPEVPILWERIFNDTNNLIIFARGDSEAITIRKAPDQSGWYIDFGGSLDNMPQ
jgi:hypothetical protein